MHVQSPEEARLSRGPPGHHHKQVQKYHYFQLHFPPGTCVPAMYMSALLTVKQRN